MDNIIEIGNNGIGEYLTRRREMLNLKITKAARLIGVSHQYLTEIEKGIKTPSDNVIKGIAEVYEIDEDKLFECFGRVPLLAREEFDSSRILHQAFSDIRRSNVSDNQKERMYEEMLAVYEKYKKR